MLNKRTEILNICRHRYKHERYRMIVKTRAEFSVKVSTKRFTQNHSLQESGWLLFLGSSPDYRTHGYPVKAFREDFNVTSYRAEHTMLL